MREKTAEPAVSMEAEQRRPPCPCTEPAVLRRNEIRTAVFRRNRSLFVNSENQTVNFRIFIHHLRVPYADVDQMGFVYYANYLVYFEMARAVLMREAGLPYGELEKQGVMLPVIEAHCNYLNSAHFDDLLEIQTQCAEIRGTRIRLEYKALRDDTLIATGHTVHVCMSPEGRVLRPHPALREIFTALDRHIASI